MSWKSRLSPMARGSELRGWLGVGSMGQIVWKAKVTDGNQRKVERLNSRIGKPRRGEAAVLRRGAGGDQLQAASRQDLRRIAFHR